ncbi:EamA family transporter [Vibrio sp. CAIM 722]|uniref:EamA family transporter n=1 Tax=Vibrio eleionomae TaxID=2653505 RepID=A0A7X4LK45_9VIBR|nr:DMT family transporter [Vibrio eleionomae]MZI93046.1 EamA family transporter [Vibrio eleionomae]
MKQQRSADLLLLLTTFIAGWGWIFSKEATVEMPIFGFIGLRFTAGAIIIACLGFHAFKGITSKQWGYMLIGGLLQAISIDFWMYAVATATTLGDGAFIMSLSMLIVPLLDLIWLRTMPSSAYWRSLPIAICGLGLLTFNHNASFSPSQGWFLIAALTQAVYFRFNSYFSARVPVTPLTSIQLAVTGIASLIISGIWEHWPSHFSTETWSWFVASVVIATSLRFWIQLRGQKNTSPTNAAVIMIMEPVFTLLISAYWYSEQLPANKLAGCSLILCAQLFYRFTLHRQMKHRDAHPV